FLDAQSQIRLDGLVSEKLDGFDFDLLADPEVLERKRIASPRKQFRVGVGVNDLAIHKENAGSRIEVLDPAPKSVLLGSVALLDQDRHHRAEGLVGISRDPHPFADTEILEVDRAGFMILELRVSIGDHSS